MRKINFEINNEMLIIGLMSGTSVDGCDAALVKVDNAKTLYPIFKLLDFITNPYDEKFIKKIKRNLAIETANLEEICSLNYELPYEFIKTIDILLSKNNLTYDDIDLVCSHGQTIWHNPHGLNGCTPSTLQIGNGQVISAITGIATLSNFRVADVCYGGEGAPLVPMFEYIYFKDDSKDIVLQNLGGMGNLTYLKKGAKLDDVIAFDTGPANVMIDYYTNKYFNKPYDEEGKIALSGKVIKEVFEVLINDEFIIAKPPKSTGRERYSQENLEKIAKELSFERYKKEDIITTITELTVYSMKFNYDNYLENIDEVIISGGGAHNNYIMKRMKEIYPNKIFTSDEKGVSSDAKEAFAFSVIGYLSITGNTGNVKSSTGSKYDLVLGELSLARKIGG